jgi:hypothetical protein
VEAFTAWAQVGAAWRGLRVVVSSEVFASDVGTDYSVGGFLVGEASFVVGFAVGGFGFGF